MNRHLSFLARVLPIAAVLACATTYTQVKTSWKAPAFSGMKNVLVVGISKDAAIRRQFEDDFAAQLKQYKVQAVPSYTVFSGDALPSKEAVAAAAKERNIDTILLTRVTDRKNVQTYVPGSVSPYNTYWGYYGFGWGQAYSPGYTVEHEQVVLETNLYNAASEALEWTAISNTTTQGDRIDVIRSFIPAIVKKMAKDKLFQA